MIFSCSTTNKWPDNGKSLQNIGRKYNFIQYFALHNHLIMKKCFFLFLFFVISLSAISQEATEMQQVMTMHDEVMEKMPKLVRLVNNLQTAAQKNGDDSKYERAIENLKAANNSMQDWMVGFGQRFDADEMMKGKKLSAEKKAWLQEEKTKILAVDREIEKSIKKAEALLNN